MNRVGGVVRRAVQVCAVGLAVVALTGLVAEALIRIVNPVPPVQIVRASRVRTTEDGDIPIWLQDAHRMNLDCPARYPDAENVVFSGDSIFFGSGIDGGREFTAILQARFDSAFGKGRWCVLNLSQPGYSMEQKDYWLKEVMRLHKVRRVFWEVWPNDLVRYRKIGDSIYGFPGFSDAGKDRLPSVVPGAVGIQNWLFRHSRLFEYLVLTRLSVRGGRIELCSPEHMDEFNSLKNRVEASGAGFTAVLATRLDRSFETSAALKDTFSLGEGMRAAFDCLFEGFDTLRLDVMFRDAGASHLDVRLDECCHFNVKGHELLAEMFFEIVGALSAGDSEQVRKTDK